MKKLLSIAERINLGEEAGVEDGEEEEREGEEGEEKREDAEKRRKMLGVFKSLWIRLWECVCFIPTHENLLIFGLNAKYS